MRTFEIIPAIDLWGGRLARMRGGDRNRVEELPGDPMDLARNLVDAGAEWLHVVDLDAAVFGAPANLDLLAQIADLPVRVQAGGSLNPDAADEALGRGAARAVLGAGILSDPAALASAVARHGDRLGVAVDVRDGVVVPRGSGRAGPSLDAALEVVVAAGPAFVTVSSTTADGQGAGPDLDVLRTVLRMLRMPVIASGGIRSVEDLQALAAVEPTLHGAIVGRALHDGVFSYEEAVAAVSVR